MRRVVGVLLLLAACGGSSSSGDATSDGPCGEPTVAGRAEVEVPAARGDRQVLLDVPATEAGVRMPVVVLLHGAGGTPEGVSALSGFPELGARDGVLVVSAEGSLRPRGWVTFTGEPHGLVETETPFLDDLVAHLVGQLCVDADRVSVVGLSNGAAMALLYACESAQPLHAAVAVAGILWPGARCDGAALPAHVGVWHGSDDHVFESFLDRTPAGCCGGILVWGPDEVRAQWEAHLPPGALAWTTMAGVGHDWPKAITPAVWELVTSD